MQARKLQSNLINSITKTFTQIITNRITSWAEINNKLPECQSGFRRLHRVGLSSKLIRIIKSFYDNAKVTFQVEGVSSSSIKITEGALQGDTLSPLLFSLFLADINDFFSGKGIEEINIDSHA